MSENRLSKSENSDDPDESETMTQLDDEIIPMETNEEVIPENIEEKIKEDPVFQFPLGRIKNIMKCDPDVKMMSHDTHFLISKATELFIQCLAQECYKYTLSSKKKTLSIDDVTRAIEYASPLAFLDGAMD